MKKSKRVTAEDIVNWSEDYEVSGDELNDTHEEIEMRENDILDLNDEIKQQEEDIKVLKQSIPDRQKRVEKTVNKLAEHLAPIAYAHYPALKRMKNLRFSASWLVGGTVCLSVFKKKRHGDFYECIEEISMNLDEFEAMLNGEGLNAIIDSEIQELQAKIKELEARKS